MIFTENDLAQYKRWLADIDHMQYLISKVKFSTDKDQIHGHLEELRGKAERLGKELGEFLKVESSEQGHSER